MRKTYEIGVPNQLTVMPEPGILFTRDNATLAYHALGTVRDAGNSVPEQDELYAELGAILFPTRQERSASKPGVHAADCGLQGSGLRKHCTCHVEDEGPFSEGDLIEYITHETGLNAPEGWVPGVFRDYPLGHADRFATATVRKLYAALRRHHGYVLSRHCEIRRIPASHVSAARSWAADCTWLEGEEDIADMSDLQVVAGVQAHYTGGWAAFRETCTP